jgi:hypothetical protein
MLSQRLTWFVAAVMVAVRLFQVFPVFMGTLTAAAILALLAFGWLRSLLFGRQR